MKKRLRRSPSKNKIHFELLTNKIISKQIDISLTKDPNLKRLMVDRLAALKHELEVLVKRIRQNKKKKKND